MNINKENGKRLLIEIFLMYKFLFLLIFPIFVSIAPVIPYIMTDDSLWMWFMIISLPLGSVMAEKYWGKLIDF